ncbi:hypothetical protein RSSM_00071 [Rhodopirellula sallentina SM41]|uniref:Uncharacterized protein n=1 Tax=Rhodopirellula sallentina SM41 TaxID=1263870 RepID=M5UB59_9BACT|nr:hypothetical protein RSSM_00071 [Rhodopirellula sallentina SM41]
MNEFQKRHYKPNRRASQANVTLQSWSSVFGSEVLVGTFVAAASIARVVRGPK